MASYVLKCLNQGCGREYPGKLRVQCEAEIAGAHSPSLLAARYTAKQITIRPELPGIFQFSDWLPTGESQEAMSEGPLGRPFTYRSVGLAASLGLDNLHIAFSGFWPKKGPALVTRSFKEFEVQASIARLIDAHTRSHIPPLVVASAGNTANAYSLLASQLGLAVYLVVPESGLDSLLLPIKTSATVLGVRGDYSDAIQVADSIRQSIGAQSDGGVRNVARRAGMGTVFINSVIDPVQGTQSLFDHYFQAIGSGSGAIATWEALQQLTADGRFGRTRTRIHVAQNAPFIPVPTAWSKRSRSLADCSTDELMIRVSAVSAVVLANRNPAYSITGGLYDVLMASQGCAWGVSNPQIFEAARLFRNVEGIDIAPAGAVATAALISAISSKEVRRSDSVLLHITGGGEDIRAGGGPCYRAEPIGLVRPNMVGESFSLLKESHKTATALQP